MTSQHLEEPSSPGRSSFLLLLIFLAASLAVGFPGSSRAEDNGNVYGFMRSEWQRSSQPSRAASAPSFARRMPSVSSARFASFRPAKRHYAKATRSRATTVASRVAHRRFAKAISHKATSSRRYASASTVFAFKPRWANVSFERPASFDRPRRHKTYASLSQPFRESSQPFHESFNDMGVVQAKVRGDVTYCVRLCDGFFLPMTYSNSTSTEKAAQACAETWPQAETAVYKSRDIAAGIEAAVTPKTREPYTALPTAYAYRNEGGGASNMCTAAQLAEKPRQIWDDPTLRKGDIFVSDAGAVVFSGRRGPPYAENDFAPVSKAQSKANRDVRLLVEATRPKGGAQVAPAKAPSAIKASGSEARKPLEP